MTNIDPAIVEAAEFHCEICDADSHDTIAHDPHPTPAARFIAQADFDAAIKAARAEGWDKGYDAGVSDVLLNGGFDSWLAHPAAHTANPYRDGTP